MCKINFLSVCALISSLLFKFPVCVQVFENLLSVFTQFKSTQAFGNSHCPTTNIARVELNWLRQLDRDDFIDDFRESRTMAQVAVVLFLQIANRKKCMLHYGCPKSFSHVTWFTKCRKIKAFFQHKHFINKFKFIQCFPWRWAWKCWSRLQVIIQSHCVNSGHTSKSILTLGLRDVIQPYLDFTRI